MGAKPKRGEGAIDEDFLIVFEHIRKATRPQKYIYKLPATPSVASARKSKKKVAAPLSLMGGGLYDFHLIKKSLKNVILQPVVQKVNVVKKREQISSPYCKYFVYLISNQILIIHQTCDFRP